MFSIYEREEGGWEGRIGSISGLAEEWESKSKLMVEEAASGLNVFPSQRSVHEIFEEVHGLESK